MAIEAGDLLAEKDLLPAANVTRRQLVQELIEMRRLPRHPDSGRR